MTLRRYLWKEIAVSTAFVLFALLALFLFFDLVGQLDEVGRRGFKLRHALAYVALTLPSRTYELMPIGALIGTIYALSKLAASSEFTIMRVSGMSTGLLMRWLGGLGVVLVLITYALGELVSPSAEKLAQQVRLKATDSSLTVRDFRTGIWVRDIVKSPKGEIDGVRFINISQVTVDAAARGWRIFEFDRDQRLRSILTAQSASYAPGSGWTLTDAIETTVPRTSDDAAAPATERTVVVHATSRAWQSDLTPDIFGILLVQPERMAGWDLAQYIHHLSETNQETERYEIAFWSKLFYPLAILVMMTLALPFAYLHVRAGGVSLKIFSGVMIGVAFYGLNKLFAHLGLLNTWPPILVAALPSLVALALAIGTLYWIERR